MKMWRKKRKIKSRFIMQGLAVRILSGALPAEQITICTGEYSIFGSITYISLQAADVSRRMIGVNFLVCLALFLFMLLLRKSGTPLPDHSYHGLCCAAFRVCSQPAGGKAEALLQ